LELKWLGRAYIRTCALALLTSGERVDAAILDISKCGRRSFLLTELLTVLGTPFVLVTGSRSDRVTPKHRDVPGWETPFDPQALVPVLPLMSGPRDHGGKGGLADGR
jgi:hypothetical protein